MSDSGQEARALKKDVESLRGDASKVGEHLSDMGRHAKEAGRSHIHGLKEGFRENFERGRGKVKESARSAYEKTQSELHNRPGPYLGAAFALGFVAGWLLRPKRFVS